MSNNEKNYSWGEKNDERKVLVALGVFAAAAAFGFAKMGPKGFDADEAAKNWSPPPSATEQELLETMSMKDRYGLELNEDGVVEVYEDLLKVVDDANNLSEQLPSESAEGPSNESGEPGSPPIEPLVDGEYAKDPNGGN